MQNTSHKLTIGQTGFQRDPSSTPKKRERKGSLAGTGPHREKVEEKKELGAHAAKEKSSHVAKERNLKQPFHLDFAFLHHSLRQTLPFPCREDRS